MSGAILFQLWCAIVRAGLSFPRSDEIGEFLHAWQTLVGAFLGVFAAALSAILIVYLTRALNRKNAANVIWFDLQRFIQTTDAARVAAQRSPEYKKANRQGTEISPRHVEAGSLFRNRPKLTTVFESAMAELAAGDVELALELAMFVGFHDAAESMLALGEAMEDRLIFGPKDYEPPSDFTKYLDAGLKHTESAVERAKFIIPLIARLYRDGLKSPFRRFYRTLTMKRVLEEKIEKNKSAESQDDGHPTDA